MSVGRVSDTSPSSQQNLPPLQQQILVQQPAQPTPDHPRHHHPAGGAKQASTVPGTTSPATSGPAQATTIDVSATQTAGAGSLLDLIA